MKKILTIAILIALGFGDKSMANDGRKSRAVRMDGKIVSLDNPSEMNITKNPMSDEPSDLQMSRIKHIEEPGNNNSTSQAQVVVPSIPDQLSFAGESVPLHLQDVKNALERELQVTMYMHSKSLQTLRSTQRYFAIIEPILKEKGVPDDFKYLCMAESGLNPEAVSSAKAGGLWQFMEATGKSYGLECGADVDMRFHLEKSTRAACDYLLSAYERFGSWTLAAASYNLGQAGVGRRMNIQYQNNYYDMYFPEETLRYVYRILSFKVLTSDPLKYGFDIKSEDYFKPFKNYKMVEVEGTDIDWSKFAKDNGTNYKMLRMINPWIRTYKHSNKSGKKYMVAVPINSFREEGC